MKKINSTYKEFDPKLFMEWLNWFYQTKNKCTTYSHIKKWIGKRIENKTNIDFILKQYINRMIEIGKLKKAKKMFSSNVYYVCSNVTSDSKKGIFVL